MIYSQLNSTLKANQEAKKMKMIVVIHCKKQAPVRNKNVDYAAKMKKVMEMRRKTFKI